MSHMLQFTLSTGVLYWQWPTAQRTDINHKEWRPLSSGIHRRKCTGELQVCSHTTGNYYILGVKVFKKNSPRQRENGPNKMAEENRKQTVLCSSFKTHWLLRFIFYDEEIQFCHLHTICGWAWTSAYQFFFGKNHVLNIARVDLSPPPLAVSKMFFFFCFLFIRCWFFL